VRFGVRDTDPMTLQSELRSITTIHPSLADAPLGQQNQQILRLEVVGRGGQNLLQISEFVFSAKGTNATQITGAKVFYTGASNTFSTSTQFGTTLAGPTLDEFVFTSATTIPLANGSNYF